MSPRNPRRIAPGPLRYRGGAAVEYLIVLSLLVLVLLAKPDAIPALISELRKAYTSFVYALSLSWM